MTVKEECVKEMFMSGEEHRGPMMPGAPCRGAVKVPTLREQEALRHLRIIKKRVRELKHQLAKGGGDAANRRRDGIVHELHHLKQEWDRWEEEKKDAARERMILLGHEEA